MPTGDRKRTRRIARHRRVRLKVNGIGKRPRFAIFRSLQHIYAQLIDDTRSTTLASASSLEAEIRNRRNAKSKTDVARLVGALMAQRAIEVGIEQVVVDRGGHKYHGRVKALADAAREGGLKF